nr:hypothetical protein [uncultured Campylobacter sp.]
MTIYMNHLQRACFIGDIASCYAKVTNAKNSSITTALKVVVQRLNYGAFLECVPVRQLGLLI